MTSSLVNLTIDDQRILVPKENNIILVAQKLGIHIPHYCYHEKLSISGNCRMCLVEVGIPKIGPDRTQVLKPDGTPEITWMLRPQIACATTASEGMVIRTNSKMVEECRKGIMEFLLINHPLDCPICDEAGQCHLQEYSVEYGNSASRFVEEKVHKPKRVRLGPHVMLDDERCIMCSRCIRFCQEITKDDVLGFMGRGSYTTLGCYPGKQLNNNYSLNTVDLCPVGALTSIDFRFKMRVWFLKETESICTSCSTGCNLLVGSREGIVYRYTPRRNDTVNSDWMCDWGRLNYKWINDENRLKNPKVKISNKDSSFQDTVDWETAISTSRKLLTTAHNKLAILASGRCSTEELYLLKKITAAYGVQMTDIVAHVGEADTFLVSADKNPNTSGAQLMGLTGITPGCMIPKICEGIEQGNIRALLIIQECAVKAGIPKTMLQKLDALIVLDILPSETTKLADVVLPGAAHVEKRGTFINTKKRIQRFQQALFPKSLARVDWEILSQLLLTDITAKPTSFEGLFKEMCNQTSALKNLTWNEIGDHGVELGNPDIK